MQLTLLRSLYLMLTWRPNSLLASQGAPWNFRTWGLRDATGHQFVPPASPHGRKSACSIPARWVSGSLPLELCWAGLAPPGLDSSSCGPTSAPQGDPWDFGPSLEPHRKGSNVTLQILGMAPWLPCVTFFGLTLWPLLSVGLTELSTIDAPARVPPPACKSPENPLTPTLYAQSICAPAPHICNLSLLQEVGSRLPSSWSEMKQRGITATHGLPDLILFL